MAYLPEAKFLKEGKVKKVFELSGTEENQLLFEFTDKISVFDKIIPSLIPGKGMELRNSTAYWFKVAKNLGITTHYIASLEDNQMLVKRAGAFPMKDLHEPDYSWANETRTDYQIPLEVIARYYIAGSMFRRVQKGVVKPEELGYPAGHDPKKIKMGEKLPEPKVEVTTKFENFDRPIPIDEAFKIAGMRPEEYNEMKEIVLKLDEEMARQVESRGLIHVDGKKEFAFGPDRELMLIDTFGTGDEDRFWLKKEFEEEGKRIELSKQYVRNYYTETGYLRQLEKVREENEVREACEEAMLPEPEIPALPEAQVQETARLYRQLTTMLTGKGAREFNS